LNLVVVVKGTRKNKKKGGGGKKKRVEQSRGVRRGYGHPSIQWRRRKSLLGISIIRIISIVNTPITSCLDEGITYRNTSKERRNGVKTKRGE
jgi:hypothetical protein